MVKIGIKVWLCKGRSLHRDFVPTGGCGKETSNQNEGGYDSPRRDGAGRDGREGRKTETEGDKPIKKICNFATLLRKIKIELCYSPSA